jgi:hypothetical protein
MIPRNVQFINGSAFCNMRLSSITIESWNNTFIIENYLLIDISRHKLIRNFSTSSTNRQMTRQSGSQMTRNMQFGDFGLLARIKSFQSIFIPHNGEVSLLSCFDN